MAVPTYDQFVEPILRYLAAHPEGVLAREAHEAAADALQLSAADRQELLPSGTQATYKNRAGWAHDRLKRASLSFSPRRGYWQLTADGFAYAQDHPAVLSPEELARLAIDFTEVRLRPASVESSLSTPPLASPDDQLATALNGLRTSVASELRDVLAKVSPSFFETIVLDLLHRMGYGANRSDLQRVGGSGDGGIDGVISLDKLGLEKVYVQAKRWQQSIGRPEVQAFYGALAGQRANKGVFLSTASFTSQAIEFARSVERVVLVDGMRLAELMIEFEVGISSRTVKIPKIDYDYFDEGTS